MRYVLGNVLENAMCIRGCARALEDGIYIYIYIERERERESEICIRECFGECDVYFGCIENGIYIYIERERERRMVYIYIYIERERMRCVFWMY